MKPTESQARLASQGNRELVFHSIVTNRVYPISRIQELDQKELEALFHEVTQRVISLEAAREDMEQRIQVGEGFAYSQKLRRKCKYASVFKKALQREYEERKWLAKSNAKFESARARAHDIMLRKFEYSKRKHFFRLILDAIGSDSFERLSSIASELANQESPDPTKTENRHLWESATD